MLFTKILGNHEFTAGDSIEWRLSTQSKDVNSFRFTGIDKTGKHEKAACHFWHIYSLEFCQEMLYNQFTLSRLWVLA